MHFCLFIIIELLFEIQASGEAFVNLVLVINPLSDEYALCKGHRCCTYVTLSL